jgi:uridine kinase
MLGRFTEWLPVKAAPVLIVEGVGAARAAGRSLASLSIFIDTPRSVREARSLARDGEAMQAQLARWRRREDLHFGADATAWCADVVIGSAHDDPHS